MHLFQKLKNILSRFKKNRPKSYYLFWLTLVLTILYLLNFSLYGLIFFGLLATFLILKIKTKIAVIFTLALLALSLFFLLFLQDKYIAELLASYAYLFLGITIIIKLKILFKKGKRIPLRFVKKLNYQKLNIFLLIFLSLILFQKVLVTRGQIEGGDLCFPIEAKKVLNNQWFMWKEDGSYAEGAKPNLILLNYFFHHLPRLSAALKVKLIFGEMIMIGVFSIYLLTKRILRNFTQKESNLELTSLLVAIFYLFNPYALNRIFHLYHWIPYLLLPLIFFIFLKSLETRNLVYVVLLAFLLNFISFSPHYLIYIFITLGLFLIINTVSFIKNWPAKINYFNLLRHIRNIFIFTLCFILLGSYWSVPYLKANLAQNALATPSYMFTKEYIEKPKEKTKSIVQTLSLKADPPAPESKISNFFFKIFTLILPFLLVLPYLIYAKLRINPKKNQKDEKSLQISLRFLIPNFQNKWTIFFSILGIVAAIISTMPIWHYTLYQKILFDLPYFKNFGWLFRESFRICGLLAFSYSFLLGFLFLKLMDLRFKGKPPT